MLTFRELMLRVSWGLVLAGSLAGLASAQSVPAPEISILSSNSFAISYASCAQCLGDGIEEFHDQTGSWVYIGSGEQSIVDRPPGTYSYRVVYLIAIGRTAHYPIYGPTETVTVNEFSEVYVPWRPSLPNQYAHEYVAKTGDLEGDGSGELLLRRLSPAPDEGDGTIGNLLLRPAPGGAVDVWVPDDQELAMAEGWLAADIELRRRDVNIDGYLDIILDGLDRVAGFGQVADQILFAPGLGAPAGAAEVRKVDADLRRFSNDLDRHLIDPEYYPNNAPLNYALIVSYAIDCGWASYGVPVDSYFSWPCSFEPYYFYVAYRDYSVFDSDAMAIASADHAVIHGSETAESGLARISDRLSQVLEIDIGGWEVNELLGDNHAVVDASERLGIGLFSVVAGISDAVAQEVDGADDSDQRVTERVLLKGRRVLGQGPFHTVLEFRNTTVSAHDSDPRAFFDGRLVSQVNWPPDHPNLTLRMGFVDGPSVPPVYWSSILAADSHYPDNLRYDLFPSLGANGYNSNSFVSGVILATRGIPTMQIESFVGAEVPVPASAFN